MIAKKVLLLTIAILAGFALLELGARLDYRIREGHSFPADAYRENLAPSPDADLVLRQTEGPGKTERAVRNKVLHPFLGFVYDHTRSPDSTNRFGFLGPDPVPRRWARKAANERPLRVAVAGGSVALQLYSEGGDRLRSELARLPAFEGREVELFALTLGGYKQPQQLMALAWFLSLGASFDIVINLDGFNEVTLPYSDNAPNEVFPPFPRNWHLYARKALDPAQLADLVDMQTIRNERGRWRERLGTGTPAASAFVLRVLGAIDERFASQLASTEEEFRKRLLAAGQGYQITGPFEKARSDVALFRDSAALWEHSSLQMHNLCEGSGCRYFHFLQPNQYLAGSKPFSGIERSQMIRGGFFKPKAAVRAGYPLLARAGERLHKQGVRFQSLTGLFGDERRTVYRDSCCHFNQLGGDAIATEIASAIGEAWGEQKEGEQREAQQEDAAREEK